MMVAVRNWFERFLEEPFYQAELSRAKMLKEDSGTGMIASLAGALSHNYCTLKTWSK
ncbi:MAG: hypothetical protein M1130_02545 [Actinobacteria bacterium]|nr:hypothetical protein [Actinomycetota bacterium]